MASHAKKQSRPKRFPRLTKKPKPKMPTAEDYFPVLKQYGEVVAECASSLEGAIIIIKPKLRNGNWVIRSALVGIEKHAEKISIGLIKTILANDENEQWRD